MPTAELKLGSSGEARERCIRERSAHLQREAPRKLSVDLGL